jgi:hypothetical protein
MKIKKEGEKLGYLFHIYETSGREHSKDFICDKFQVILYASYGGTPND